MLQGGILRLGAEPLTQAGFLKLNLICASLAPLSASFLGASSEKQAQERSYFDLFHSLSPHASASFGPKSYTPGSTATDWWESRVKGLCG